MSYSINTDALGSPSLHLSCSIIAISLHITIKLIITHLSTPKSTNQRLQIQPRVFRADPEEGGQATSTRSGELRVGNGAAGTYLVSVYLHVGVVYCESAYVLVIVFVVAALLFQSQE